MKRLSIILSSPWLTGALLIILIAWIIAEIKATASWSARLAAGERAYAGNDQAKAIANAIEQYCTDFPDCGSLDNNREWSDKLEGHNSKGIRYLKVKKYGRDSAGRLLDLCGTPWIIVMPGSQGFEQMVTPQPPDEFQVRSAVCPGFSSGHRNHPMYPRS